MQDSAAVLCALRDLGFADLEWNYLGINSAVEDSELSYAHRQLEPSRSGASGIEIQQPIPDLLLRHMRVPGNHKVDQVSARMGDHLVGIIRRVAHQQDRTVGRGRNGEIELRHLG